MTDSGIWWKAAADRIVGVSAWLLGGLALVACGSPEPPSISAVPPQPLRPEPEPISPPSRPDLGFIPLPTVEQVQRSAPGGRADPFQPFAVEGDEVFDPASGLTLTGVMRVGTQRRALVQTQQGSGLLCLGADGRCVAEAKPLLPLGWSVLSIDVEQGCLGLARNGEAQELICLS